MIKIRKRGQVQNETVAFIISAIIIILGILIWMGVKGSGPLYMLQNLLPSFDKPKVDINTNLEGVIKYDGKTLQYYRDVKFEDATLASDGTTRVFFINQNALKYDDVLQAFDKWVEVPKNVQDMSYPLESSPASKVLIRKVYEKYGKTSPSVTYPIMLSVSPEDSAAGDLVILGIDQYSLSVPDGLKYPRLFLRDNELRVDAKNGEPYLKVTDLDSNLRVVSDDITKWAMDSKEFYFRRPIELKVYGTSGNEIVDKKCGIYSVLASDVTGLNGETRDYIIDLSTAKYARVC